MSLSAVRKGFGWLYDRPNPLLVLTSLFWAGNAIAGQLAIGEITPMQLVLLRWVVVLGIMWPLFGRQALAAWPVIKPRIGRLITMAILGFTGFNALFYLASTQTSGVNIGILQGSVPVFVLIAAFVAHGARVGILQGLGVAITLTGVALVATQGRPLDVLELVWNQGDLLMLLACLSYALYAVLLQSRPDVPGTAFFTLMLPVAALTAVPAAIAEAYLTENYSPPSTYGLVLAAWVGLFPSCLAQLFFLRGVDLIGPGRAGVYTNLVPVFAAGLAVLMLGQVFDLYHAIALVLVLGGIAIAQRRTSS